VARLALTTEYISAPHLYSENYDSNQSGEVYEPTLLFYSKVLHFWSLSDSEEPCPIFYEPCPMHVDRTGFVMRC
jgi:hypothetical protein